MTNCKYCQSFPEGLWNFVNLYLDGKDIDKFQNIDVNRYYVNLITDFMNTKFHWKGDLAEVGTMYDYEYVKDLPDTMLTQAIDCLGVVLGWGPKNRDDKYISNAVSIYIKYLKE